MRQQIDEITGDYDVFNGENDRGPIWITKDEREIPVKDLDTMHLSNIIKLLLRSAAMTKAQTTIKYLDGPGMLGDEATLCFEQEFNMVLDSEVTDYVPAIFKVLWKEWNKRRKGQEKFFDVTYGDMDHYIKKVGMASIGIELKAVLNEK
jgi:hypothetical protein